MAHLAIKNSCVPSLFQALSSTITRTNVRVSAIVRGRASTASVDALAKNGVGQLRFSCRIASKSGECPHRKNRAFRLTAGTLCFHFLGKSQALENRHVNRNVKQNVHGNWWRQPGVFGTINGVIKAKEHQTMDMISLHDIQKSYGSHQILKIVDLTIRQGEIYGLIGKTAQARPRSSKLSSV